MKTKYDLSVDDIAELAIFGNNTDVPQSSIFDYDLSADLDYKATVAVALENIRQGSPKGWTPSPEVCHPDDLIDVVTPDGTIKRVPWYRAGENTEI